MSLKAFEKQEVEQFTRNFESLFYAGDAATMASFYADDAKLMAEDMDPILGRSAIEQFWKVVCEQARQANARRKISLEEVTASGNLGYALGVVVLRVPKNGGQEHEITFKYATIWRREGDGRWRLVVDISNRNASL
jgi:uncharacterized protein (TIGR02246 family)